MNEARPVKILDATYDEKNDFVIWRMQFLDTNSIRKFCWPSADIGPAFGIRGKIEKHHILQLCEQMKGKTIKMVCEVVGDPEHPMVPSDTMIDIIEHSPGAYFPQGE